MIQLAQEQIVFRVKRGMRVRRNYTQEKVVAVGPFFTDGSNLYFLTVCHGVGAPGADRKVQVRYNGFNWLDIGTYVMGVQNEYVDWAMVKLNENAGIVDAAKVPDGLTDPGTGIAYDYQSDNYLLYKAQSATRETLKGKVPNSPTYKDQLVFVKSGKGPIEGDSGIGVYSAKSKTLGIEWGIEWDGYQNTTTFYVQPIENVARSIVATVMNYDQQYRTSQAPPPVWALVKPIADFLAEAPTVNEKVADVLARII